MRIAWNHAIIESTGRNAAERMRDDDEDEDDGRKRFMSPLLSLSNPPDGITKAPFLASMFCAKVSVQENTKPQFSPHLAAAIRDAGPQIANVRKMRNCQIVRLHYSNWRCSWVRTVQLGPATTTTTH